MISIRVAVAAKATKSGLRILEKYVGAFAADKTLRILIASLEIKPFIRGKNCGQRRLVAPSWPPYKNAARDKHGLYKGHFLSGVDFS